MADVFGDLDLFSEFEKDREAVASYIHYGEDNSKSRIVFEDFESDKESESEDDYIAEIETTASKPAEAEPLPPVTDEASQVSESKTSEPETVVAEAASTVEVSEVAPDVNDVEKLKQEEQHQETFIGTETAGYAVPDEMSMYHCHYMGVGQDGMVMNMPMAMGMNMNMNMDESEMITDESEYMMGGYEKMHQNGTMYTQPVEEIKLSAEDEAQAAWLNEQLHAEAAEEAKKSNTSSQQLIYDRNKYRRYAKILDSTRYVPDDESPAVQLIFNNNSFARKYRQQIEQFIKGLLWEEFHSVQQDTMSEILIKPGHPSCIDINSNLTPEQRTERMRQKHGIIGNSQFHKQFLIDFLGWPFTVAEPTRCNVNWEIPLYGQVFNEVYADPTNRLKRTSMKKGPSRYHMDPDLASKFTKFKPGVVSDSLKLALGLAEDQLPQHIYKMRLYGYPPGWLAEARQVESGVTIFDKNGRVTLITGECLEDGELDDENPESKTEYDVNKIIEFPGFTVDVPDGYLDEHALYKMPPIQQHQLKKTLLAQSQTAEKVPSKKRKHEKDTDESEVKKAKIEEGEDTAPAEGEERTNDSVESESKSAAATPSQSGHMLRSSSTISLSKDFGTPILVREKIKLPDASKFGKDIEEHIPFENLPNSTGTFEKMKDLLDLIRNKVKK
ncbi:zinc finger CCHC domain-containing protein 8-like isoform X2 [Physella acuta]|uniref:zinc finger CCHC domain-containing protein 8-like isoform X2 n=1 Tax=Physella acuta TaxID=109671 RepID=UPI0027DD5A7A|nr:zinc finger CCHC domain-containing protein 8-like isoform X2 [Physella acuta]